MFTSFGDRFFLVLGRRRFLGLVDRLLLLGGDFFGVVFLLQRRLFVVDDGLLFFDGLAVFGGLDVHSAAAVLVIIVVVTVENHVLVYDNGVVDFYVGRPTAPERTAEETAFFRCGRRSTAVRVHFVTAVFDEHRTAALGHRGESTPTKGTDIRKNNKRRLLRFRFLFWRRVIREKISILFSAPLTPHVTNWTGRHHYVVKYIPVGCTTRVKTKRRQTNVTCAKKTGLRPATLLSPQGDSLVSYLWPERTTFFCFFFFYRPISFHADMSRRCVCIIHLFYLYTLIERKVDMNNIQHSRFLRWRLIYNGDRRSNILCGHIKPCKY